MHRRVLSVSLVCLGTILAQEPAAVVPAAQSTSQPAFWRYAHPKAKALIGFKADGLAKSPLGKRLAAEVEQLGLKKQASSQGFDFLSDVKQMLLSTPGEGAGKKGSVVSEHAPFVIAMQGKFNAQQMRKMLVAKKSVRTAYRGVELWRPAAKGSEMCVALAGPQIMLIGDTASVRLAIDSKSQETATQDQLPLFVRASELARMYDIWFVSEASLADVTGARTPQTDLLKDVDRLEGGMSFQDGARLELSLHANSDEDAGKMATALMTLVAVGSVAAKEKQPDLADLVNKIKVGTHEGSVMLSLHYTQAEIDRGIDSAKIAFLGGAAAVKLASAQRGPAAVRQPTVAGAGETAAKAAATMATTASAKSAPGNFVVRIYNADGGTREVALARD